MRSVVRSARTGLAGLAVLITTLVCAQGAMAANSNPVTVTPSNPAPADGVPITVTLSGTGPARDAAGFEAGIYAAVQPSSDACAATYGADSAAYGTQLISGSGWINNVAPATAYTATVSQLEFFIPGSYTVCAWAEDATGTSTRRASPRQPQRAPALPRSLPAITTHCQARCPLPPSSPVVP